MVKNININDFTAVVADDLLSSFYLLDADYIKNNTYSSSKLSIKELSAAFNDAFMKSNSEVSGQWRFTSEISSNSTYLVDGSLVPISYLALKISMLIACYNDLVNTLFLSGKMQSYTGLVIATELSTQADVKNRFGGRTWKKIAIGRFIVGASNKTAYGIPDTSKDGKDFLYLTKEQTALRKHTHDFPGGHYGGNSKVKRGNYITATIKTTKHSTSGGGQSGYSPGRLQHILRGKMAYTSCHYDWGGQSVNPAVLDKAYAKVDNRPFYIPIYFWERTS